MNSNPKHGPLHYRAPSKILWRTIRGMIPHKTARGAASMDRLKSFDGIPHPYDRKKRMVIPAALKVLRLKPHRRFTKLADLAKEVGWKCKELLERLESARKVRGNAYFLKKKAAVKARSTAAKKAVGMMSAEEKKILQSAGCA